MGLLIKLKNGDTSLKSLKFGHDRPGGGDSGQPYIQNPIDKPDTPTLNSDFLLRGGISAPLNAAEDITRLTKYFFDFKNPKGLLFTAKQNLLSRTGTKTEASKGTGYGGGNVNEGIYTPLSTLLQANEGYLGGHLNKQGLDPTGAFPNLSINKYQDIIKQNQLVGEFDKESNRLTALTNAVLQKKSISNFGFVKNYNLNVNNNIITYSGGSDSTVGVGNTNIKFATNNAGFKIDSITPKSKNYLIGKPIDQIDETQWKIPINATLAFNSSSTADFIQIESTQQNPTYLTPGVISYQYNFNPSVYDPGTLNPKNGLDEYLTRKDTEINPVTRNKDEAETAYFSPINEKLTEYGRQYVQESSYQIDSGYFEATNYNSNTPLGRYSSKQTLLADPRLTGSQADPSSDIEKPKILNAGAQGYLANLNKNAGPYLDDNGNTINKGYNPDRVGGRGIANDFRQVNRDVRGFFDPPSSYDYITKESGSDYSENGPLPTLDRIYYKAGAFKRTSTALNSPDAATDIIPFRITIVDPRNPKNKSTELNFRAYIDSFSDTYNNEWKSQTYIGRAEKQYKYNSFDRSISFGFTIVADNSANLSKMYEQLNTLAASIAPTYTSQGYMTGNLHRLTLGNYLSEQWGIMNGGFTYEITDETPWQISEGNQLPLYIKVTGINFTVIHNFRPESQFNTTHQFINQK
jgi:hypothetical protein